MMENNFPFSNSFNHWSKYEAVKTLNREHWAKLRCKVTLCNLLLSMRAKCYNFLQYYKVSYLPTGRLFAFCKPDSEFIARWNFHSPLIYILFGFP